MTKASSIRYLVGASALVVALAGQSAYAQTVDTAPREELADEQDSSQGGDIVVTGTLIRGIAPVGTNVVGVSREEIVATGATSANEILANIPQVSNTFLQGPNPGRPILRSLGASSGSTTLILIDGHRVVGGAGASADPDLIPPAVIERVELVLDGGSAIYGSDAIGGVINFITRRRFDGLEANARVGIADHYNAFDGSITAGKSWETGSAYLSYSFSRNDPLFGRDRDFVFQVLPNTEGFCPPGTVFTNGGTVNGNAYALPGRTPGILPCDSTDDAQFAPKSERHNVYAGFNQNITDTIEFDVRGFYSRKTLSTFQGPVRTRIDITPTNPYFVRIGDETSQSIFTSFIGNAFEDRSRSELQQYGVTSTLKAELGSSWRLTVSGNYQRSRFEGGQPLTDAGAIAAAAAGTTTATALNPYNLSATNPTVLAGILREQYQKSNQHIYSGRAIAEGPLFRLPGGSARLAVGVDYLDEAQWNIINTSIIPGRRAQTPDTVKPEKRTTKSAFFEFAAPIVGADNASPGLHSLTLSLSGRYNDYSDSDGSFNPKVGLTYEPFEGIKLRGNWGRSFSSPGPGLKAASGFDLVQVLPIVLVPGQQAPFAAVYAGFVDQIEPQTATTWSVGLDVEPTAAPGLKASVSYYNIHLKDMVGLLSTPFFSPALNQYVRDNQSCAQMGFLGGELQIPLTIAGLCALNPATTFAYYDLRQQNLGQLKQDGIDFNVGYRHEYGFGTVHARVAGTYILNRENAVVAGLPFVSEFDTPGASRWSAVASAGLQTGGLTFSVDVNHRAGYDRNAVPLVQASVGSFTTVDAFAALDLPVAFAQDLQLTLNVTNLFDQDPPFFAADKGFTNGSTLGRLLQIGIRTKF